MIKFSISTYVQCGNVMKLSVSAYAQCGNVM